MEQIIRDKFRRNASLRTRLVQVTAEKTLVNKYPNLNAKQMTTDSAGGTLPAGERHVWGVIAGSGQNLLGVLLEKVRTDCVDDSEIENWI
jgi:predicted NAD-dependent protein-ADP-ribosyltransferase YbiA (DUF1768 family)